MTTTPKDFEIRPATEDDAPLILDFIKKLAVYEKLAHKVTATEDILLETLFGERRYAEVIIGYHLGEPVGFALFFHNYSTFLGKPGIYLEDLFVDEESIAAGLRKGALRAAGETDEGAELRSAGMGRAQLERTLHQFLQGARRRADERLDGLPPDRRRAGQTSERMKVVRCQSSTWNLETETWNLKPETRT